MLSRHIWTCRSPPLADGRIEIALDKEADMDVRRLTRILLGIGGVTTMVAVTWWAYFYGQITKDVGGHLGNAISCLYSSGGACGFVSGFAQLGGVVPYNPLVFWIGIALFAAGVILRLSLKEEGVTSE